MLLTTMLADMSIQVIDLLTTVNSLLSLLYESLILKFDFARHNLTQKLYTYNDCFF